MSKKMVVFGGTGGIGKALQSSFPQARFLGSKDVELSSEVQVEDFFDKEKPDIVVNLSGYNADGFLHKQEYMERFSVVDVNIMGTLSIVRHALPSMRKNAYGRIILASSFLANTPHVGTAVYSASKCFVESIARSCALENGRNGVTCNAIRLGYFPVGMTQTITNWEKIPDQIPLKRFGRIDEIARTIQFLIDTEYVTGTTIELTGGL